MKMEILSNHQFFDEDIEKVVFGSGYHKDIREILLAEETKAIFISKEDVIALAKEFELVVYEKESNL